MSARGLLLFLLSLCWSGWSACAQYTFRSWTTDNGLPQNIVRSVYQTPDGYLWIATLDGLARFDGVRFTIFNTSNTPGLVSNRLGMVGMPNGDLWLPTESGDLMRYSGGRFEVFGPAQGIRRESVRGIVSGEDGRIWILYDNAVYEWRQQQNQFVNITPGNLHVRFAALRWDQAGFWGQDSQTLYCFRDGQFKSYPLPPKVRGRELRRVASATNGDIWFETPDRHQYRISEGKPAVLTAGPGQSSATVLIDSRGNSWKVKINAGLDRSLNMSVDGETKVISFGGYYVDRDGNAWIRTEGQGLFQFQRQFIHVYSEKQGLPARNISPIYQDKNGAIWVGAWNSGLSRYQNGKFTNFTIADGLPNELVTSLFEDRDGRLWIGTHGGLAVYEKGRIHLAREPDLTEHEPVQAIHQDRIGTLWFGMPSGLISYKDGVTKHYSEENGMATNDTHVILESRSGDLWIGGYGGLTRLRNDVFTRFTKANGLPSESIRSLYEDRDGILWIGTYDGGLARYASGKFVHYTTRDGLFNNGVFQILEDGRGNFWISCNRGIYRIRKTELNEFANGSRNYISSVPYGKADGLLNEECNGGLWPAGIRTREGELWFPTQAGIAVIRPESMVNDPKPPSVLLEQVLLDNVQASMKEPLRISPGTEQIDIQYSSPGLVRPAQLHFRYRLEPLDRGWVEAGPRRTAFYSHVPPGDYTFHVIAENSNGLWSPEKAPLSFTVLAPFYLTWWFKTLSALMVAVLIAYAWNFRVSQLERAQAMQRAFSQQLIASQENERKRIAAELHDSIGQRLVVIKNLALLVLRPKKSTQGELDVDTLQEISAEASHAIEEARQISYDLRPFQLDRLGLKKAIESMVRTVATASGIQFTSEIDNIDNVFAEDLRINFYRIVQESLGNIMKHAQATEVQIRIKETEHLVTLTISDNGCGFNLAEAAPQSDKGGFGLTGLRERARLLGGQFKIQSSPGRGTVVNVELPLKAPRHV